MNKGLEYIIEQVEEQSWTLAEGQTKIRMEIDRYIYVKEYIWVINDLTENLMDFRKTITTMVKDGAIYVDKVSISMNGNMIVSEVPGSYIAGVKRYESHTNAIDDVKGINEIYVYPFCLEPEKIDLNGMITTEKFNIVNINLDLTGDIGGKILRFFQRRMNILRIKDGHGSLVTR
jgi:hypothetical protein